jgi:hypothetical protein
MEMGTWMEVVVRIDLHHRKENTYMYSIEWYKMIFISHHIPYKVRARNAARALNRRWDTFQSTSMRSSMFNLVFLVDRTYET